MWKSRGHLLEMESALRSSATPCGPASRRRAYATVPPSLEKLRPPSAGYGGIGVITELCDAGFYPDKTAITTVLHAFEDENGCNGSGFA
jgi:hypothetical protein